MLAPASTLCLIALPTPLAASVLHPVAILVLCIIAGVGTVLMLLGRREAPIRKIGGVIVLSAFLLLLAIMVRQTARITAGEVYFWLFSIIAIFGAIRVISHSRPVYSALYFVLTVLASAGLFILAWAEFMAAALVLIYAGAILVTYVFVIMLAAQSQTAGGATVEAEGVADYDRISREPLLASAVGFVLMGVILFLIFEKAENIAGRAPGAAALAATMPATQAVVTAQPDPGINTPASSSVRELGLYLYRNQMLSLELAGLLLTLAMVGAVVIARRQVPEIVTMPQEDEGAYDVTSKATPTTPDDNPHSIPVYGTTNPQAKVYPEK